MSACDTCLHPVEESLGRCRPCTWSSHFPVVALATMLGAVLVPLSTMTTVLALAASAGLVAASIAVPLYRRLTPPA